MRTLPVPFAMRPVIGFVLIVVAVGIVLYGVGRVATDVIAWYKDQMTDPYSDLRRKSKETRKARRTLEEVVGNRHVARGGKSDDDESKRSPPGID